MDQQSLVCRAFRTSIIFVWQFVCLTVKGPAWVCWCKERVNSNGESDWAKNMRAAGNRTPSSGADPLAPVLFWSAGRSTLPNFLDPKPGSQSGYSVLDPRKARVSVVIPCFNQGRYLRDAVQSVLAQTRQPDEIIIINDGSTHETAEVAACCKSVDYIVQENRGLAAARNTGLRHATANYILFLDSDDVLLPKAIEHCLDVFSAQPDVAFVYGGFQFTDAK
jgi:hypothetical protein